MTPHTPDEWRMVDASGRAAVESDKEWYNKVNWINENRVELEIGGLEDGREKKVKENNQGKG